MASAVPNDRYDPASHFQVALRRLGGDTQLLREMGQIFLEDLPTQIGQMRRYWRSTQPDDLQRLEHAVHRIKGMVVTFDDQEAGPLLEEMLEAIRKHDAESIAALRSPVESMLNELYDEVTYLVEC